ncbi:MAG: hypothetical protein CK538_08900 [Opitutia bacterium]|nr:MAG: hypothetical protein CK538_08900 [Opitutae bacterium]
MKAPCVDGIPIALRVINALLEFDQRQPLSQSCCSKIVDPRFTQHPLAIHPHRQFVIRAESAFEASHGDRPSLHPQ